MAYDITVFEYNEQEDLKKHPVWFLDGTHSVPSLTPMSGWLWVQACRHGMQVGAERLQLPTVKGWDWRLYRGGAYMALLIVEDEDEIKERTEKFRQEMVPFLEDYQSTWQKMIDEMVGRYEQLKACDIDNVSNIELFEHFDETIRVAYRMWELHMYMMYLVDGVFILFEQICKELLDIDDTNPDFHKLMRGFDNKVFQLDKRQWEFGQRAKELGLAELILNSNAGEYIKNMESHPNFSTFMQEFKDFLWENGWRGPRYTELMAPLWVEDPNLALFNVYQLLKKGDFDLDEAREKLARERTELEKQILAKVPEEQRDWFTSIMRLAQQSSSFSEEHGHYFDLWAHAMVRRACLAWGKRLAAVGTIAHTDDVFFLIPDEIRKVAHNPEFVDLTGTVSRRRAEWEEWQKEPNPPMIARVSLDEAMAHMMKSNDPIALKVVVGAFPVAKPELKADLYGVSGSPGVAEGIARVVITDDDLVNIQEGEILVAPATYVSWTAIFPLLAGVVVDRGASLSHAAIVGREYGIPVVMNTFEGSTKIQTGQRIRVDGDFGVVYFLDK